MTTTRPSLDNLDIDLGKRARLHRILYRHGLKNGTMLALPIDQGLEHGPIDFFPNPPSQDPGFQWRLAVEGGLQRHRLPLRARAQVHAAVRGPGAAHPEAQRQDQHPAPPTRRFRRSRPPSRMPCASGPDAVGLHALRRHAQAGRRFRAAAPGAAGLRALRHAAGGVVVSARRGHRTRRGARVRSTRSTTRRARPSSSAPTSPSW